MTGRYSRRVLEVQGVTPAMLKYHPGVSDLNSYCDSDEFPATFSNSPGRYSVASETLSHSTLYSSVSSLDDDEFEKESSETVQQLFNNIDSMLFGDEELHDETGQLREECNEWADQYCHLRVLGKQLVPDEDLGYQTITVSTENLDLDSTFHDNVSLDSRLGIHGKQMGISIPMDTNSSQHKPDSLDTEPHEEILLLEGEYEELIAVDYSDDYNVRGSNDQHLQAGGETDVSVQKLSAIKENLGSLLGNKIWNEVVSWMRPLFVEYMKHIHYGFPKVLAQTAPSALPSNSMPKTSIQPNARLATAPPRSTIRDDFKGLLTVTSKTLQLRNDKYNGSLPQNYGTAGANPMNFVYNHHNNDSSFNTTKKHAVIRRVPTAVRLTPLDHSLKANLSDLKNDEWVVGQTNQRPKTTKQLISTRVPSSYWNRQIHLPPIQNSDGHCTAKNRTLKASIDRGKRISSELLDATFVETLKKDLISKQHDFRKPRLNKQDGLWKKTSSLQPSADSVSPSSQNLKDKVTEQNDSEVLDEETVHTVEPFVTWLLSQVQSNACKASGKLNFESATK